MFSRAMIRLPTAAWIGTSYCWRGISSFSFAVIARPYSRALSACTIWLNASTGWPCNRMSTLTRFASCSPAGS
jgi:hypothetical protein